MIEESFASGKIIITDASFGHVVPGDDTFLDRFEECFAWRPAHVLWMQQTHSDHVRFIEDLQEEILVSDDTDGVMSSSRDVMLITKTADCVPILLWNEKAGVIAALHAGWNGFVKGIIDRFAEQCQQRGFELADFSAFIGPHLRLGDFEVRQDFIDQLSEQQQSFLQENNGSKFFDLTAGVVSNLKTVGVNEIRDCGINTYNNPDFFSYRSWTHTPVSERPEQYSTFANCIIMTPSYA